MTEPKEVKLDTEMGRTEQDIYSALFAVQKELEPVTKDSVNPHYKSRYASLLAITEKVRPLLLKHNILCLQPTAVGNEGKPVVITNLIHIPSKTSVTSMLEMPLAKMDPHGVGSGIKYSRRYALESLLGIITDEDDDGNAACVVNKEKAKVSPPDNQTLGHRASEGVEYGGLSIPETLAPFVATIETAANLKKYWNSEIAKNKEISSADRKVLKGMFDNRLKEIQEAA
jgi:hypothetical protein